MILNWDLDGAGARSNGAKGILDFPVPNWSESYYKTEQFRGFVAENVQDWEQMWLFADAGCC
jgi:hypothetical protein